MTITKDGTSYFTVGLSCNEEGEVLNIITDITKHGDISITLRTEDGTIHLSLNELNAMKLVDTINYAYQDRDVKEKGEPK